MTPRQQRRWPRIMGTIALTLAAVLALLPRVLNPPQPNIEDLARAAAHRFLDRYMEPDGRVVRRDQGGDTVSEGQAYAMLLALAIGDLRRFDQAWRWAKTHLQRKDGLLSWRWQEGRIQDPNSASDVDFPPEAGHLP